MEEVQFGPGDVIFREGDEADAAYFVVEGEVEIRLESSGTHHLGSRVREGEILGEMALLGDRPRSATAIAATRVRLLPLSDAFFDKHIAGNPGQVRALIGCLVERLRNADARLRAAIERTQRSPETGLSDLLEGRIEGQMAFEEGEAPVHVHSDYREEMGFRPFSVAVSRFPFRIGRAGRSGDGGVFSSKIDLEVEDHSPFQVSRVHCDIVSEEGCFFVRDKGSRLGTIVNGRTIGTDQGMLTAALGRESNTVVLGLPRSPHRLTVIVGKMDG